MSTLEILKSLRDEIQPDQTLREFAQKMQKAVAATTTQEVQPSR